MRNYKAYILFVLIILGINYNLSSQCLTCNTQDPAAAIPGAGAEAAIGTWNIVTNNFNGQDYAVFSLTQGYTYEWEVCGVGGFATPLLSLFTGSSCSNQTFVTSNSGACATISFISSTNQDITILLSELDCSANATNLTLQWRATCSPTCSADVNHAGADWTISSDSYIGGNHTNIGTFTIDAGVTAYLSCHTLHIEATNIVINGTLDGNNKGAFGGTGGDGGAPSTGSDGSCSSGGIGQAGSDGTGSGPGFAGGDGLLGGCTSLDCTTCKDGYIAGSGGAGSGGGAAHFDDGGTSGSGAQAADVNGTDAIGGFGGNGPWFGSFAYGDNTSFAVISGSGGGGAGGGGGGYTQGSNGGNGGAGGGRIELIATNTVNMATTAAIYCNGYDGGDGGDGGYGSLDNIYECFDDGNLENTDNCGICPLIGNFYGTGGAGGGAGGGSGGGILISSADLATILGIIEVFGGQGGDAGFPNTTHGDCFRNSRGGSGGVGGRIKIFRNPCLENQINPTTDVLGGLPGVSVGGTVERAPSGILLILDHPSYVPFDAGTIGVDQDICADGLPDPITTIIAPTGGIGTYTYQWWTCSTGDCTNPPVGYTPIGGANSNNYTPPTLTGTTYYSLMVQSGSDECREWTTPVIITVHPDPSISIVASDNDVCEGQAITLTATVIGGHGACTIQWQYSDDGTTWTDVGANSTTYDVPTGTAFTNRQYRATYECTSDGCDIDISNVEIINVAIPPTWDSLIVTPLEICISGTVTFSANVINGVGGTIEWFISPAGAGTWTSVTSPDNPGLGSWDYQPVYTPGGPGCIIADAPINTVVVVEDPIISISATETQQCENDPLTLSATASGGSGNCSYQWQYWDGANWIDVGGDSDTYIIPATTPFTDVRYRSVYTCDGDGCNFALSNELLITIFSSPTVIATANPNPQCSNDPVDLSATGSDGLAPYTYDWDNGLGAGQNHTVNPAGNTTYTVTIMDSNNCTAETSVDVVLNTLPTLSVLANPNPQCGNEPVDLTATGGGGIAPYTYDWDNGLGADSGPTHTVNPIANTTYSVTVTDSNGCSTEGSVDVVMSDLPTITVTANPNPQCANDPVDLSATAGGGTSPYSYDWDNGLGAGQNHTVNPIGNTTYTVTVTDVTGCSSESSIDVILNTLPNVTATANPNPQCANEPVDLSANAGGGTAPYSYDWDNGLGAGQNHTVNTNSNTTYTVTVSDSNGCTAENSIDVIINSLPLLAVTASPNPQCNNEPVDLSANSGGGLAPYTYEWDNGLGADSGPNHTVSPNVNTIYSVTVTDSNGCSTEGSINVIINELPTVIVTETAQATCGLDNGEATATPSGGTIPYSYLWDNGDNSNDGIAEDLAIGPITVTVTDSNGCTTTGSTTITSPPNIVITATEVTSVQCMGGNDGVGNIDISGGNPTYDVSWTNGITSGNNNGIGEGNFDINNLTAGTYTIQVTDSDNCVTIQTVDISEPTDGISETHTTTYVICPGDSDGSIDIVASGGTAPYTYTWNPDVSSTASASGLPVDTYFITITDAALCELPISIDVELDPNALAISFVSTDSVSCFGGNDGSLTILATGGTPPYNYLWDNGPTIVTTTGPAGNYTITVSDNASCVISADSTIYEPNPLASIIFDFSDIDCLGDDDGEIITQTTGGTAPYTYYWEDDLGLSIGVTTATASNLPAGTYYITINDANSCGPVTLSQTIIEPASVLSVTISEVNQPSCYGGSDGSVSVTTAGGTLPIITYQWAAPIAAFIGHTPTNLEAGDYEVTVTDANGCIETDIFTLHQPVAVTATITVIEPSCNGDTNGSATALGNGGHVGYSYHWENAAGITLSDLALLDNVGTATYFLTITDALGCEHDTSIFINEPVLLAVSLTGVDASTYGNNDGSATALATDGVSPYTYEWEDQANPGIIISTSITATNLETGTYCVTVTDFNLCTISDCIFIDQPADQLAGIVATHNDITCFGFDDGNITINGYGGTPPYIYEWQDNLGTTIGTNPTISNLEPGDYYYTVTDQLTFEWDTIITIIEPTEFIFDSITNTHVSCYNGSDAHVEVTLHGGSTPYVYSWENQLGPIAQDNDTLYNVIAGFYSVTIIDANGCGPFVATSTVNEPSVYQITISLVDNPLCNGDSNGEINTSVIGGTLPYVSYQWSNPIATYSGTNPTNIAADTYSVTVTDSNLCTASDSYVLTEPTAIAGVLSSTASSGFGASDGSASVVASEGSPGYTFEWENSANAGIIISTSSTATNLLAGNYCVTIYDTNMCEHTDCIDVVEPAELDVIIDSTNVACNGYANGTAIANPVGGIPPYTYEWRNSLNNLISTNQSINGLPPDTYYVTITDANNYTATANVIIVEPDVIISPINSISHVSCNGFSDGSVTLDPSGGTTAYSISWYEISSPAIILSTSSLLNNVPAGTYIFSLSDANGCTHDTTIIITEPSEIIISSIETNHLSCPYDINTAWAVVNFTGGTPNYTFIWTDAAMNNLGVNNDTILNLIPGDYNVEVQDINGCPSDNQNFTITIPDAFNLSGIVDSVSCNGGSDGEILINTTGGTPNYSYQWTPNLGNTNNPISLSAATYTVTITDDNACTAETSFTVEEPVALAITSTQNNSIDCYGDNTASLDLNITGGTLNYSIYWENSISENGNLTSNSEGIISILGLYAANYNITVTDNNNCQITDIYIINQPSECLISISLINNPLCNGDSNGEINTNTLGGTPPYTTYQWAAPIAAYTGTNPTNLSAGLYSVTVTDSNLCTATDTYTLIDPSIVDGNITAIATTGFGASDGSASVIASDGTPGYTYEWENSAAPGIIISTLNTASNLNAGNYCVTVYDTNMCEFTACIDVTEPAELIVSVDSTNIDCYGANNGTAIANPTGGTPEYSYEWRNSANALISNNQSIDNLPPDTYFVTITDANNYTTTASVTIVSPEIIISPVSSISHVSCNGLSDGAVTLNPFGGTMPYIISWYEISAPANILSTNSILNNIPIGTYIFNLIDGNGCTHDTTILITEPGDITILSVEANNLPCPYDTNTGWAVVNFSGGNPAFTYTWTDAAMNDLGINNDSIFNLIPGDYNIEVQDVNGCPSDIASFTITIPDAFSLSGTTDSVSCYDGTDGAILLNVSGGTSDYTYLWNPDIDNSNNPTDLIAATYTVTVIDNNMCTAETSFIVGQPDNALAITANQINFIECYGDNTASIDLNLTGGTLDYSIIWENSIEEIGSLSSDTEGTISITSLLAADYYITVTDSRNCQVTETYTISQPEEITYSFIDIIEASCNGFSDASVSISATGGTGSLDYLWDDMITPVTHDFYNSLEAGWHYITITDDNLCQKVDSVFIGQPERLTSNLLDELHLLCYGDSTASTSITIIGGTPDYSIIWYDETYQELGNELWINQLPDGEYYLSITDSHSCTYIDTINIIEPTEIITSMNGINPTCYEYNDGIIWVTTTGGTPDYNYTWDTPGASNLDTVYNVPQGMWHVTITDANMCTLIDTIELIHPDELIITDSTTHVDCSAFMGTSTLTITGGTPTYEYEWSTEDNTSFVSNLPGGEHQVIVTDSHNCISTHTIDVPVVGSIQVHLTQTQYILCFGDHTAAIRVDAYGHPPYSYEWNNGLLADTSFYDNLPASIYEVTVTDSWNCVGNTDDTIMNITQPDEIIINFTSQNVLCRNDSTAWISANITGGTGNYSLNWEHDNSNDYLISNLTPGTYYLNVSDMNSCEAINSITITQPDSTLFASIGVTNSTCFGSNDGQAFAQGHGGTPPYTYFWAGPYSHNIDTAITANNLFSGTYQLTITDNNQCKYYTQVINEEPNPIVFSIHQYMGPSCLGNSNGYIFLDSITGGTPPYWIRVANEEISWEQTQLLIDSLNGGVYHIDVIDSHNCIQSGNSIAINLIDVEIDCLQIPAAFSPNGDGYNDYWQIDNLHLFPKILIQVYNRWGQLLYEGGAFDDFWDGTFNGNVVPTGAYLYHIDLNNELSPVVGTVTIIR